MTLSLNRNYSLFSLVSYISLVDYYIFGFIHSVYTLCLLCMVVNYKNLPHIINYSKKKLLVSPRMENFKNNMDMLIQKYRLVYICDGILYIGDFVQTVILKISLNCISRIKDKKEQINVKEPVELIDDFMINDNSTDDKLIEEQLDNLLDLGQNILIGIGIGKKEEQIENVGIFMRNFNNVLKYIKDKKE